MSNHQPFILEWSADQVSEWILGSEADYTMILDTEGIIVAASSTTEEKLASKNSTLINKSFYQFFPLTVSEKRKRIISEVIQTKKPFRYEDTFRPDKIYDTRIRPILDKNGSVTHLAIYISNITETKKIEEERFQLATAVEQTAEGVVIFDADFAIRYVNQSFQNMTGFSLKEAKGKKIDLLYPDTKQSMLLKEIKSILRQGDTWTGRMMAKGNNQNEQAIEKTISPIWAKQGLIRGYVSIWRDITDIELLEKQLRTAQKMEAIATLAGGIAHDFNNILGPIILHAELLQEMVEKDTSALFSVNQILEASQRAKTLVSQILSLRKQREGKEYICFDLSSIVKECLKLLRPGVPSTISIVESYSHGEKIILADPVQIHQVIMNLCTNAIQSMPHGGELFLEIKPLRITTKKTHGFPTAEPGRYLSLKLKDTGHGISSVNLPKIFDPFFTTKESSGSGLGLSVVHSILTNIHGHIRVQSKEGKGSLFEIILPSSREQLQEPSSVQHLADQIHGNEHILIVDDDLPILHSIEKSLQRFGYTVTSCSESTRALSILRDRAENIDLIVSDIAMPKLNGVELAKRILATYPAIPIVLMSGFAETITHSDALTLGVQDFITKPFHIGELASSIRRVFQRNHNITIR